MLAEGHKEARRKGRPRTGQVVKQLVVGLARRQLTNFRLEARDASVSEFSCKRTEAVALGSLS
jgi:hypothetical protein